MSSSAILDIIRGLQVTVNERFHVLETLLSRTAVTAPVTQQVDTGLAEKVQLLEEQLSRQQSALDRLLKLESREVEVLARIQTLETNKPVATQSNVTDFFRTINQPVKLQNTVVLNSTLVPDESVDEEDVEPAEEEVEEQEEEEVEEQEEVDLEEFTITLKNGNEMTYVRDTDNNVYIPDEDGCVDLNEVVGVWNPKTNKIQRVV